MDLLQLEWPPWKSFMQAHRTAQEKFEKAVEDSRLAKIEDAKDRALGALRERADATGG